MKEIFYEGKIHKSGRIKREFKVFDNKNNLEWELTQGIYTLVDYSSFDLMKNYIWRAQKDPSINSFYALTNLNNKEVISLHRLLGDVTDCSISVDHKDRNPLNNTINNLRLATPLQQCFNQSLKNNKVTSHLRGVTKRNDTIKPSYRVRAQRIDGTQYNVGTYSSELSAAEAWDDFMYEEYKNDFPLKNITKYKILGEPTLNFIPFNFPKRLGL